MNGLKLSEIAPGTAVELILPFASIDIPEPEVIAAIALAFVKYKFVLSVTVAVVRPDEAPVIAV
jgi:hypothetical protein